MPGPLAGYGWQGAIESWAPGQVVEIPDGNAKAVAWARGWLEMGAQLVEDVSPPPPPEPSLEELRARAVQLGVATYGSKAQLVERIAKAEREEVR